MTLIAKLNDKRLRSVQSFSVYFLLMFAALFSFYGCQTRKPAGPIVKVIDQQQHKDFLFNQQSLLFSSRFPTARLNRVAQQNDSTFVLDILAENVPINPSPWYAFKIWSSVKRNIYITLHYPDFKHRYDPKQRTDFTSWQPVAAVKVSSNGNDASFKLQVAPDTITVAGQELISSADSYRWMDTIAKLPFIKEQVAGKSLQGKPIQVLNTTGSAGKKIIAVLSRQHPPEVTGYMAMQEFIRTTLGSSDLAVAFRKEFELVIVPMINPDGVDGGNWRHSAAGVDLNRDWTDFKQPETSAVRDYMVKLVKQQQAKVYFAIDFHSTFYDVFYINQLQDPNSSNKPGFTNQWLAAMRQAIPGFKPNIKPSGNGGDVSKSWFSRALQAEAITYEVGDETPRDQLKLKGRVAAEQMMKLLLKP